MKAAILEKIADVLWNSQPLSLMEIHYMQSPDRLAWLHSGLHTIRLKSQKP